MGETWYRCNTFLLQRSEKESYSNTARIDLTKEIGLRLDEERYNIQRENTTQ